MQILVKTITIVHEKDDKVNKTQDSNVCSSIFKMSQGKRKHHLTKLLQIAHRDAVSNRDFPIDPYGIPNILKNVERKMTKPSTATWTTTSGLTSEPKVMGPKTFYAKTSGFQNDSYTSNSETTISASFATNTNFKIGEDSYMDLNKVRVITKLKVICTSNVNSSRILYPTVQSSISKDDPPTQDSYKTQIEAFRLNPGGYQGFNIYKITKDQWDNKNTKKFSDLLSNESLFKSGEFHHSEIP